MAPNPDPNTPNNQSEQSHNYRNGSAATVSTSSIASPAPTPVSTSTSSAASVSSSVPSGDSDVYVKALLDRARQIATTRPSEALGLVLNAVRHREGEVGVFRTLDRARADFGLEPFGLGDTLQAQIDAAQQEKQRVKGQEHVNGHGDSDNILDADIPIEQFQNSRIFIEEETSRSNNTNGHSDGGIDPAAIGFDSLSLATGSSAGASLGSTAGTGTVSGPLKHQSHLHSYSQSHHPYRRANRRSNERDRERDGKDKSRGSPTPSSSASSSSSSSASNSFSSASSNPPYPKADSLAFNFESLSLQQSSNTQPQSSFPFTSSSSDSPSPTIAPLSASLSVLELAGHEDFLTQQMESEHNFVCTACGGLFPKDRRTVHELYWCDANANKRDDEPDDH